MLSDLKCRKECYLVPHFQYRSLQSDHPHYPQVQRRRFEQPALPAHHECSYLTFSYLLRNQQIVIESLRVLDEVSL
ncbi:hypothetical protein BDZ91DRAFT_738419, partial [Kalaharituber pfeilii]